MMKRVMGRVATAAVVMAAMAWPLQATTMVTDRLSALDGSSRARVVGTVHPLVKSASDLGVVADSRQIAGMTLYFARTSEQQAALEALIAQQLDPTSPQFHQWLTPAQFGAQFGLSANDLAAATAWLTEQGFTVNDVAESANAITFSGTAGQVRAAFGTEIHGYALNGETHFANASEVSLPAALATAVLGIRGLNDFKLHAHLRTQKQSETALFTSGISGSHFLAPGDLATIYDVGKLYTGGYTGTGQYIGIAGQTDVLLSDVASYRAAAGLSVNSPVVILKPGSSDPGYGYGGDLIEADLDMEISGGIAPSATVVFLNSGDVFASIIYGITNTVTVNSKSVLLPIISISYGACESQQGSATITTMEAYFQQAAAQGQTIVGSSGDTGATDCDNSSTTTGYTTGGLAVDYPASSAYVTGVGGTEFNEGTAVGPTTYWSGNVSGSSSTDVISSALSYMPEVVWNDTPTAALATYYGTFSAGGGGASSYISKPSWQTGVAGIPNDGERDVPDIALDASDAHDPYLMCTEAQLAGTGGSSTNVYSPSCGNGFRISDAGQTDNNNLYVVGGTSAGAPLFAGILSLIEQKLGSAPLGLVNKALYTAAANSTTYASAFHDITSGSNAMPCIAGAGCVGGYAGYSAGTGYDQATGLGSIDAYNLSSAISGSKPATTTAITYLPTPPVIGQAVTFTATVTKASGTATPTGTVIFTIDSGTGVTETLSGGVATYPYSGFATGGTHTVTAQYSGDTNYYGSTSTATLNNFTNASGAAATTITLSTNNSSFPLYAQAGAVTFTATVSSTTSGTLSGVVYFTIGSTLNAVNLNSCSTTSCTATFSPAVSTQYGFSSGTDNVTATYSGNTNYKQSTSNTVSVSVLYPPYTISVPAVTVSSNPLSAAATDIITITTKAGFSDQLQVVATTGTFPGCYTQSTYTITPASNSTATITLTLGNCFVVSAHPYDPLGRTGNGAQLAGFGGRKGGWMALGALLTLLMTAARRRRLPRLAKAVAALALAVLMVSAAGCGNGSSGSAASSLPTGTYTMGVSSTDLSNSAVPNQSTSFTVTVQ